jgi:transposase
MPARPAGASPARAGLAELPLPDASRHVVDDLLAVMDSLQPPIDVLDKELAVLARGDPRTTALMELPGVGTLTAVAIVAEVGDIDRFPSARKLSSWAGLTPTVHNFDRTVRHGRISKQGSPWLRWIMCEAAQTAKRHPDLAPAYQEMARRRGKKIATTGVASKLLAALTTCCARSASGRHHRTTQPTGTQGQPHTPGELATSHGPAPPRSMSSPGRGVAVIR